jgi:hypothetical protein
MSHEPRIRNAGHQRGVHDGFSSLIRCFGLVMKQKGAQF